MLRFALLLCACLLAACAEGGTDGDGGVDASTPPPGDSGVRRDSGPTGCPSGQHDCGGGCIDDLDNEPANGCRLGCGEACPTPPDGEAACAEDGTCTVGCTPPFRLVDGECVCEARTCEDMGVMCGAPEDGCGMTLDCGTCMGEGSCIDGLCACAPDAEETNDSSTTAPMIDSAPDENTWERTYDMWNLDEADDEDWVRFSVEDTGLDNPSITVTLDQIPMGSNYDLAAYYVCDSGGENSSCGAGMPDNMIGNGCASASSGTTSETVRIDADCDSAFSSNDSGSLFIRVTSSTWGGSCAPYRIRIRIES